MLKRVAGRVLFELLIPGCWAIANFEGPGAGPAREAESVAALTCAPDAGFTVLGRLTATESSLMPVNQNQLTFDDDRGREAMRQEAAAHGCDAILGYSSRRG